MNQITNAVSQARGRLYSNDLWSSLTTARDLLLFVDNPLCQDLLAEALVVVTDLKRSKKRPNSFAREWAECLDSTKDIYDELFSLTPKN